MDQTAKVTPQNRTVLDQAFLKQLQRITLVSANVGRMDQAALPVNTLFRRPSMWW